MTVTGPLRAEPAWLAARVAETGRRFDCVDRRVNGTVWWYSASSELMGAPIAGLLRGESESESVAASVRHTLESVIAPLARISGAGTSALWAIASDSLGNRALAAAAPVTAADLAVGLAGLIGPPLPVPRFVDVGPRRFLRRSSCCLIYRTGAAGADAVCVSCPHQRPEVRAARLAEL